MDARLQLKTFVFQVEQLRMAQIRIDELKERVERLGRHEDIKGLWDLREMCKQLEWLVDTSILEFNTNNQVRVAPEQAEADNTFQTSLEQNLKTWQVELEQVQKDQMDQAIIDAKEGRKSARYDALEKNESRLLSLIAQANLKLGKVQERAASPAFNNVVQQVVNSAKA